MMLTHMQLNDERQLAQTACCIPNRSHGNSIKQDEHQVGVISAQHPAVPLQPCRGEEGAPGLMALALDPAAPSAKNEVCPFADPTF